jgi:hypothetical protein
MGVHVYTVYIRVPVEVYGNTHVCLSVGPVFIKGRHRSQESVEGSGDDLPDI